MLRELVLLALATGLTAVNLLGAGVLFNPTAALLTDVPAVPDNTLSTKTLTTPTGLAANPAGHAVETSWNAANGDAYKLTGGDDRAFSVFGGVLGRIFASLMSKQKQGQLSLISANVEHCAFEVSFESCVECSGQTTTSPLCCFHAGVFAGIFAAMLDRELDAFEETCPATGGQACVFKIGVRDARSVKHPLEQWLDSFNNGSGVPDSAMAGVRDRDAADPAELVDIGYYQLLLSSCFLTHAELFEGAYHAAGADVGHRLGPFINAGFEGGPRSVIEQFYRQVRHMSVNIVEVGEAFEIRVAEAPEAHGAMGSNPVSAFICGELESLLSDLTQRAVSYVSTSSDSDGLMIRFAP